MQNWCFTVTEIFNRSIYWGMMKFNLDFMRGTLKKRMLWSIMGSVCLVFLVIATITVWRVKNTLIKEKEHEISLFSEQCSTMLSLSLNQVREQVKMLTVSQEHIFSIARGERRRNIESRMRADLAASGDMVNALWSEWDAQALDSLDAQMVGTKSATSTGRFSCTVGRENGTISLLDVSSDADSEVLNEEYYLGAKNSGDLYTSKAYFEEGANTLMVSISSPIKVKGSVRGVVGGDINISTINKKIKNILSEQEGRFFVVDAEHNIQLSDDDSKVGKKMSEVFLADSDDNQEVLSAVEAGNSGFFEYYAKDGVHYIAYLSEANTFNKGEVSVTLIPKSFISKIIAEIVFVGLVLLILGFAVLYVVIMYIVRGVVVPVEKVTTVLKQLGDGEFDKVSHIEVKTNDELETMANSLNSLHDSIMGVAGFAESIGSGDLSAKLQSKGEGDILGNSLVKMRDELLVAEQQATLRKEEDERQSWVERSVANFGKELRNDTSDAKAFYNRVVQTIVHDLDINQAGLYLLNDNDEGNKFFEVVACMAWGREKMKKGTYMLEEGLIGACYFEKAPIVLTEIPDDYVNITSGLGGAKPKVLMLVPLIHNENVVGIIEIASFKPLEEHKKSYLNRVAEELASTLISIRVNARTSELLSISQMQAEEMQAQEEEMRQNMEELHATQEEMKRKNERGEIMQQAIDQAFVRITLDRSLSILDINTNGASVLGSSPHLMVGTSFEALLNDGAAGVLRSAIGEALSGTPSSCILTFNEQGDAELQLQVTLVAEQEPAGAVTMVGYKLS